ncbi:MAG TPA: hypothetical protein VL463_30845 [Kofleriaceae bacterium]|nr:hypothetical protein [Kofleriaceae bacterium]
MDARDARGQRDEAEHRRRERMATVLGLAAVAGAAGALSAAAFGGRWFSEAAARDGAVTWAGLAPIGFVITEAIVALATAVIAALSVMHVRAGRMKRAYALALIMAGVRGATLALMADPQFRAGWSIALGDLWAKLVLSFAVAQVVLLLALFGSAGARAAQRRAR